MRFLFIGLLTLLVGCRPPDTAGGGSAANSTVRVRLEPPSDPKVGPTEVRVYLLGADNQGIAGAVVSVTGTMTHAGMTPIVSGTVQAEDGLYRTQEFTFDMAGDWLLEAEATLPDGSSASDELPLTVSGD